MTRDEANKEILKLLEKCLNSKPNLRFNQLLAILDQDQDLYYREPQTSLQIMKELAKEKGLLDD